MATPRHNEPDLFDEPDSSLTFAFPSAAEADLVKRTLGNNAATFLLDAAKATVSFSDLISKRKPETQGEAAATLPDLFRSVGPRAFYSPEAVGLLVWMHVQESNSPDRFPALVELGDLVSRSRYHDHTTASRQRDRVRTIRENQLERLLPLAREAWQESKAAGRDRKAIEKALEQVRTPVDLPGLGVKMARPFPPSKAAVWAKVISALRNRPTNSRRPPSLTLATAYLMEMNGEPGNPVDEVAHSKQVRRDARKYRRAKAKKG
jgi:hypothetical protein